MLRSSVLIVAIMVLAGLPSLAMPFRGDEALFAVVARELSRGAVLYRDYWDVTNPGVFWFYQLGGSLFGFTEEGIRLFEWVYLTAFVLILSHAVRRAYRMDRLPMAPVFFVGVGYYLAGYSGTSILTKTEGLVGLPLFLAVWLASRATEILPRPWPWLVGAGMAGGAVLLLKLLFAVCLGVCWAYLFWVFVRSRDRGARAGLVFVAGIGAGVLLALSPALFYFARHGALDILYRTLVELPPRFLAEGYPPPLTRLALSARWFFGQYSVVLAAAVLGARCRLASARDPFVVAAVLLVLSAGVVLLAQRLSWWTYHFLLLGTPAGVLAAYGWPGELMRSGVGRFYFESPDARAPWVRSAKICRFPNVPVWGPIP